MFAGKHIVVFVADRDMVVRVDIDAEVDVFAVMYMLVADNMKLAPDMLAEEKSEEAPEDVPEEGQKVVQADVPLLVGPRVPVPAEVGSHIRRDSGID